VRTVGVKVPMPLSFFSRAMPSFEWLSQATLQLESVGKATRPPEARVSAALSRTLWSMLVGRISTSIIGLLFQFTIIRW